MYIKSSFLGHDKLPDCNAYEALWNRFEQAGWSDDLILHIDGISGRKRTYQEFRTRAVLAATTLGNLVSDGSPGVRSENGEMTAIISDSSLDCAALVHSLLYLARPFALFDSRWTLFEFENALKLTKPTQLFVQDQLILKFAPMAEKMGVKTIYVLGQKINGLKSFEEMIEDARSRAMVPVSPYSAKKDTLACLVFSSGTTGPPKAVMISHGNIIANLYNTVPSNSSLRPNSFESAQQNKMHIRLINTPICVISGLHSCCFGSFITPITCVIITDPSVEATLEAIARYQITSAAFHPSFISQLLNHSLLKDANLSSLRSVLTSGSYLSPELLAKMAVAIPHKFYFSQVYGMTESLGITLLEPQLIIPGEIDFHLVGSVGKLLLGAEARVLREDGSEADVNEPGELYVRRGTVALGYWNNEKATQATFVDGWVRTGDLVRVDQNDCFSIVGRIKDTFKTPAGRQVSPFQIEDALLSEPQGLIADVVVAGVMPDLRSKDERGKVPRAWIVLSDEGKKLGEVAVVKKLEVWYQKTLSDHKWLHGGIEIVDKIPKSTSGKPLRAALQKKYEERVS